MPWAAEDKVSTDRFSGSVKITEQQYSEAIEALTNGKHVSTKGGFKIVDTLEDEEKSE